MKKYLAICFDENEHEQFNTLKEAKEWIEDLILFDGGYIEDPENCAIYELSEAVKIDVIADKDNHTDEEWSELGYDSDYDEIWKHRFVKS